MHAKGRTVTRSPHAEVPCPSTIETSLTLRFLGIVRVGGLAVLEIALLPFGDAVGERHVKAGDPQKLVALAGIAQLLGCTHALQRLSSVPVTPCHERYPGT